MVRPRTPIIVSLLIGALGSALLAALKAIYDVTVQDFWKDTVSPFLREHVGAWSTAMFGWIGPFWSGMAAAFLLIFAVEMFFSFRRRRALSDAAVTDQELDLSKSFYEEREINLQKLLMQLSKADNMISVDKNISKTANLLALAAW